MANVSIEGFLPRSLGVKRAILKRAAEFFACRASKIAPAQIRQVVVVLQDDASSAEAHVAINGVEGATDVITQPYDAMPNEEPGIYGELYVNVERAVKVASARKSWSVEKETLLYIAHGIDHLSGADDIEDKDRLRMRRRELKWISEFYAII